MVGDQAARVVIFRDSVLLALGPISEPWLCDCTCNDTFHLDRGLLMAGRLVGTVPYREGFGCALILHVTQFRPAIFLKIFDTPSHVR